MSKKYPGSEPPMTIGPYEPELGLDLKPDTRIADMEAENARLQELVRAMELAHSLVRDEAEDERARLQTRVGKVEQELTSAAIRVREARSERDRYKALAERRREALSHMIAFFADGAQGDYRLLVREARAARDAIPEEVREKERRSAG